MLQNAYLVAKIGADTAKNEQHFAGICRSADGPTADGPPDPVGGEAAPVSAALRRRRAASYAIFLQKWQILQFFLQFLAGSVSAVSKRKFARKMRLTAFFKLYKICILLHRCNLKILAKNRFEKSAIFVKIQQNFANNFANFANLQNLPIFKNFS